MNMSKYQRPRSRRMESRNISGRFRGGKLQPCYGTKIQGGEGGTLSQEIMIELEPIAGRMLTPITAEMITMFVPLQAMHALNNEGEDYAGTTDVVREELLTGNPLFPMDTNESKVSRHLGLVPRRVAGVPQLCISGRLAHNAAVNFLRRRKFVDAAQVSKYNGDITPALLGSTVLDRLNAVLDPEDRVNGAVQFNIPSIKLPVSGMGLHNSPPFDQQPVTVGEVDEPATSDYSAASSNVMLKEDPENPGQPGIFAEGELSTSEMSLTDFYTAERMDRLTREMRQILDDNPEHGQEMLTRWAHGLSVDPGKQPFVLYQTERVFGMSPERAMDGPNLGLMQTNSMVRFQTTVPVPKTELGGMIVTFVTVKPDETLDAQPHPLLSKPWTVRNHVADELALDPVPVTVRDIYGDCDQADEETIVCYVGNNGLERLYMNYGFARGTDLSTVENKTALWQIKIPMSVTPESVIYPEDLDHYPFKLNGPDDPAATYTCNTQLRVVTPTIYGPTPVEETPEIETSDLFEDQ